MASLSTTNRSKYDYEARDCLQGCIKTRTSGCPGVVTPFNAESMSPWVRISFSDGEGNTVTVGNESAPDFKHKNSAAIKSFEYGNSDGHQCTIEMIDEQGGAFDQFFEKTVKCMSDVSSAYSMVVQFGWVGTKCWGYSDGSLDIMPKDKWTLKFMIIDVEVTFGEGKIKYSIKGTDTMQPVFVGRMKKPYGTADDPMDLKKAIIAMFADGEPKIHAEFWRRQPDGGAPIDWDFKKPAEGAWRCDNQNKLAAATSWIQNYVTNEDKGITASWLNVGDGEAEAEPTVIFWEDYTPDCNEIVRCSDRSIGTFLINGGRCSNVISFSPKINFVAAFSQFSVGGQAGGPLTSGGETKNNTRPGCSTPFQTEETGITASVPTDNNKVNNEGPNKATKSASDAQAANAKAGALREGMKAIEAELKIHGNPNREYIDIKWMVGRTASLVVINPFSLSKNPFEPIDREPGKWRNIEKTCSEWLAEPMCNNILSNKNWFIKGVHHSIKEGSYVTTLQLVLPVPGIDIEEGTLGADPDGYYIEPCK